VSPLDPEMVAAYWRSLRKARAEPPQPERLPEAEMTALYGEQVTFAWPDPYGPDPVVFGAEPRVRDGWL
jgi:hypothetical protein